MQRKTDPNDTDLGRTYDPQPVDLVTNTPQPQVPLSNATIAAVAFQSDDGMAQVGYECLGRRMPELTLPLDSYLLPLHE